MIHGDYISPVQTSSTSSTGIRIDTVFLLRRVTQLDRLKMRRRTWNEMGEQLIDGLMLAPLHKQMGAAFRNAAITSTTSKWKYAKKLVHEVITSRTPMHDAIRRSMEALESPSTAHLLSSLSLWLAGALGISTSVTIPLVAVMLYAVAEADGNWNILVQD